MFEILLLGSLVLIVLSQFLPEENRTEKIIAPAEKSNGAIINNRTADATE